jgi:1-acyl-sn-glycerol-3-phosphate acyltransferase
MKLIALRPRSGPLRWLWTYVWGPVSLACAFVPLLVLNLLQFPSLLLLPFSYRAYRAYNRLAAVIVWGWWAVAIRRIVGVDVQISGDVVPESENAIVFCNHQSMSDIPVLLCLGLDKGRIGDIKWMVKDPIKYVPGIGWGMIFLDCLFLKRNWADDEANIRATFKRYVSRATPLWLVVFPEGTRVTPKKLAESQAYAAKAGAAPTSHVLLPRPKGFAAAVQGLREHVTAVYDVTIDYPGDAAPSLPQIIRGDVDSVRVHVRRYPISEIARTEAELAQWVTQRFYEKDASLAASRP